MGELGLVLVHTGPRLGQRGGGDERHDSLEAEDAVATDSSFVKQGIEQQEEGSSGAGESWWPDPRRGGADGSWRCLGRGGDVHGAGVLSVLADDAQVGGDIATRRTERGKEK